MKRLSAVLIAAAILLFFTCGCIFSDTAPILPLDSVSVIDYIDLNGRTIESVLLNNDDLYLLTSVLNYGDEENEQLRSPDYKLYICDLDKMRQTAVVSVKSEKINNEYGYLQMKFADSGILIYDDILEKSYLYGFDGDFIKEDNYEPVDEYAEQISRSPLLDDTFICFDNFAFLTTDDYIGAVFEAQPDTAYIYKTDLERSVVCGYDTAIGIFYDNLFCIDDLSKAKRINSVKLSVSSNDVRSNVMNGEYMVFVEADVDDEGNLLSEKPYVWHYADENGEEKFEKKIDVEKFTSKSELNKSDDALCKDIKDKYDVNVKFPKNTADIPIWGYTFKNDFNSVYKNMLIRQTGEYFALFPNGMFSELKSSYNTEIDLFPVNSITEENDYSVDGVTSGFSYETDGGVSVSSVAVGCYFSVFKSTFAHELTHVFENAFSSYFEKHNDWYIWERLNPDGFEYEGYEAYFTNSDDSTMEYVYEYDGDYNSAYFYDRYAKTTELEDRARIFENLFVANDIANGDNWLKCPHLRKKAELICEMMRECFTTVNNAESVYWEENLKSANTAETTANTTDN